MKVRLENVTKKYGQTVAVKEFSAELEDGHLICLLGPSGCGKSTILNMICGIVPVTEGKIFFDDKDHAAKTCSFGIINGVVQKEVIIIIHWFHLF